MYYLLPSDEQQTIIDSIADFLSERLPVERLRNDRRANMGQENEAWPELAAMGWFGISAQEHHGGVALSIIEEALAFREYGRALLSPCVLATVIAARAFAESAMDAQAKALVEGSSRAALALALPTDGEGTTHLLFDGDGASHVVITDSAGVAVHPIGDVVQVKRQHGLDGAVTADFVRIGEDFARVWRPSATSPLSLWATLLTAAMLSGISEAVRDMAVEYAKVREQFGKPIGSFQAIKHRCADMALWAEAASAEIAVAALKVNEGGADVAFHVAASKVIATHAAMEGARHNIQVHGAIGFTAESNAHLFLKRAHLLREVAGRDADQKASILAISVADLYQD